ncbi:uncharacterized protein Z518_06508 [Rhinocladiella mackenziei CBS 650.93]|uniref:Sas10 C-terminal domain-containing protein n=1 Tax=Rhinocladiella mackenziei CBS 650.93 TaxID=1442369 RepID=A0A0D2GXR4_9EURO|nr:uncharacterized protein Z518_06508 [Rhinocladiella mackenziei CBS 650.93]KIX02958.1 hypothetical protein Z518_06508 [Rhinocladiella mackenziei CBS 650.93]
MTRKRKAGRVNSLPVTSHNEHIYDPNDNFDDSQDEFFAGRDKILVDEQPAAKRRRKLEEQEQSLQPSDEEVFQDLEDEDESEDEAVVDNQGDEDEDDQNWGTSRADYYNADVIETEADALEEEAEARRLQQKQLRAMTEADFGFDESAWIEESRQTQQKRPAVEKLPELQIPESATAEERLQMLKTRYPEFEPLTKDFLRLQNTYPELKKMAETAVSGQESGQKLELVPLTKFRALSAYLGSIAMYLALLTSSKSGMALAPGELREHPVMDNLVRCRQLWQDAETLRPVEGQVIPKDKPVSQEQYRDEVARKTTQPPPGKKTKAKATSKRKSPSPLPPPVEVVSAENKPRKSRKFKAKRNELQELLTTSMQNTVGEESDFGDEAPLTQEEAAEKARRKKSLHFYTSQITQKSNKRGAASRQAGGDDDIPYKERLRDKQDRLIREAEQRGKSDARGAEVLDDANDDNNDEDDDDMVASHQLNSEANEYYNALVAQNKQKKADKQARAEAYVQAAKEGARMYAEEQIGEDGKRKISYAIEKNKGLAPKRKRDVRNPRVKKRKKFDEKMKKLGSIRQVYKGGEGRGGYGGEKTGIKVNLVKSIKL